jgi:hypothetical protein
MRARVRARPCPDARSDASAVAQQEGMTTDMNHELMVGMFWGGVVMMAPPVLLGLGIAWYVYREWRTRAADRSDDRTY